jgi:hypothetical protein
MQRIIFILTFSLVIPLLAFSQKNFLVNRNNFFFPSQNLFFYPSSSVQSASSVFYNSRFPAFNSSVYKNFESYRFQFPQGALFCKMEEQSIHRFNVMFSLHAGVYSER